MTALAGDFARFAIGTATPRDAVAPADADELATILRACDRDRRAAVFFGGGTQQGCGAQPSRYDLAIDFRHFSRLIAEDARDLTVAAEGGCTLATLATALAEHGQFVAFDAPFPRRATVGGTIAAGWLGPRRLSYGRARDFTIGTSVVLADGTRADAGGMVVKNSTAYDLSKLYVGSLGTLAAIVRANLRTLPQPRARCIALAPIPERSRERARAGIAALALEPTAALLVRGFAQEIPGDEGAEGRAFLLFEGSDAFVDRAVRDARSALGSAGVAQTDLIDRNVQTTFERALEAYAAPAEGGFETYRIFGVPSESAARDDAFHAVARECGLRCESLEDLRTGDVVARLRARHGAFDEAIVAFDAARRTALAHARLTACDARVRERLDAWGTPPPALDAMRALKARFDPNAILAPGRHVGAI